MKILKFVFVLAIFFVFGCTGSGSDSWPAMQEALDAMESDNAVSVKTVRVESWGKEEDSNYYYVFEPVSGTLKTAFIFYPGGAVDLRAYAPPLRAIAEAGYLCFLVKMPMDLAPMGVNRATDIIESEDYSEIDKWAIGGHSVGGTFSCSYVKSNPDKLDGLAIWASYPSSTFDLSEAALDVLLIYGTNNPSTNDLEDPVNEIDTKAKPFLPPEPVTTYIRIEGGNHSQFGYYNTYPYAVQPEDGIADITREEQQEQIIAATVEFLEGL